MWSRKIIFYIPRNSSQFQRIRLFSATYKLPQSTQLQEKESSSRVKEYKDTPKPPASELKPLKKFKEPFPKSFFVGKCDPEVLEYPEVLDLQQIDKINQLADEVQQVIEHEVDSKEIDVQGTLPKSVIDKINKFHLCGAKLPEHHHGLGMSETEAAVLAEATALNPNVFKFISEQQNLAGALLAKFGTPEQKQRYLTPLCLGESIISCAFQENIALSDLRRPHETIALPDGNGGYEITGTKVWVTNALQADHLIVVAATVKKDDTGQRAQSMTAFIVAADAPGVTVLPPATKIALKGVPISEVHFKDVKVGASGIIGKVDEGGDMIGGTFGNKFDWAPLVVGVGKHLLDKVTKHAIHTIFFGKPLSEYEGTKFRLGHLSTALYALESALYLQKGHADIYENPDSFTELCILKVLSTKTLEFMLSESIQIVGAEAMVNDEFKFLSNLIQECSYYTVCDESNTHLKSVIALNGLQYAGLRVRDEIHKVRNPLQFPSFVLQKMFQARKRYGGDKGNDLGLAGYLHPSLEARAHTLEYCISRIQMCTEVLLGRYGLEVTEKVVKLNALAEMTIHTYALTASLARASRSYCIGLAESSVEIEMALAIAKQCEDKVNQLLEFILDGPIDNNTLGYLHISDRVLAAKGCFAERPITRNF